VIPEIFRRSSPLFMPGDHAKEQAMATSSKTEIVPGCSVQEGQARVDLAALYRLFVHFGWTDLTYTHISARVPGEPEHLLLNPYGLLFEEITASNLNKMSFDGKVLSGAHGYNKAGHIIHTAILQARPEINFVIHSHTLAGAAVSAMRCGLLPISQHANVVRETLAYHPYAIADEGPEECARLACDLGDKYLMILHNHCVLACGRTPGEAFLYHYFLEMACEVQVNLVRSGQEWITPAEEAMKGLSTWGGPRPKPWGDLQWKALLRMLERKDPSFRS
jgi:ribulose-5-phosphate 4-epimerase/fuculose-1-phosphate aldolase